jgi:aminoglycoside phosphotransferase (APT) family kinase protein
MKGAPKPDSPPAAQPSSAQRSTAAAPDWLVRFAREHLTVSDHFDDVFEPLAGGVSSDIYHVGWGGGDACVKRALPRLKVAADWQAPVERNRYEVDWMRVAASIVPAAVPAVLAEDPEAGCFAMAWLAPERYPVWKTLLRDGVAETATAAAVGTTLGRIHAATADRADIAARFATDAIFEAIRIEPYLLATARAHPDLAPRLHAIAQTTRTTKRALVHGDFSPKNILVGPQGPVIVDAECAWYGDPAFDVAFVLNHLLLKGVWRAPWRERYVALFAALVDAYRAHVRWEPWPSLDARTASLLPALLLARADGKSPAEYLTDADKRAVRAFARPLIATPVGTLADVATRWLECAQ